LVSIDVFVVVTEYSEVREKNELRTITFAANSHGFKDIVCVNNKNSQEKNIVLSEQLSDVLFALFRRKTLMLEADS
jgi:triosephosphate isomerase